MRGVSTLLFDLDGVLAHYQRPARLAHLGAAVEVAPSTLHQRLFAEGLEHRYDRGELSSAEYLRQLSVSVGKRVTAELWVAARLAGMRVDPETRDWLTKLAERFQLAILTNNGPLIHEVIDRLFGPERACFGKHVYCSGELAASKPDARVYAAALLKLERRADEVLFFDDLPENVAGAMAVGLHAQHVPAPASLTPLLQALLQTH